MTVLQVKRPNQQYQSTEGKDATKIKKTQKAQTQNTAIHCAQKKNTHSHFLPYLHVDLNKNCNEYT